VETRRTFLCGIAATTAATTFGRPRPAAAEPPPETRPTFPATGASVRTTIWLLTSTLRSAWAAATPASASRTTSSGALMNFFMTGLPPTLE